MDAMEELVVSVAVLGLALYLAAGLTTDWLVIDVRGRVEQQGPDRFRFRTKKLRRLFRYLHIWGAWTAFENGTSTYRSYRSAEQALEFALERLHRGYDLARAKSARWVVATPTVPAPTAHTWIADAEPVTTFVGDETVLRVGSEGLRISRAGRSDGRPQPSLTTTDGSRGIVVPRS